jgi:zinc-ribbon domain
MYCNQCGAPLQPDYRVCPKCGIPIAGATPAAAYASPAGSRMARHLRTLGILWMITGCLWLLPSLTLFGLFSGFHLGMAHHMFFGWPVAPPFLFSIGSIFLLIAVASICVGWGLMTRESWARVVAIIVGALVILHFPLGTLLGIYTLWVLLSNGAAAEYQGISKQ